MKTRLFIATTLALGTTALSTGCDKASGPMSTLANKASALESKLVDALGPHARKLVPGAEGRPVTAPRDDEGGAWNVPSRPDAEGWDMPSQGWDMPQAQGWDTPQAQGWDMPQAQGWDMPQAQGWDMPQAQGWDMPQAQGWDMPQAQAFPNVMPTDDFQQRLAAQQQAFQAHQQQVQADSNRRFDAVQDWTKTVIRGE